MKKVSFLILMIFIVLTCKSQTVSCNALMNFVVQKGYLKGSISSYTMNSKWLHKVTAYSYEYNIYVIAEIKKDEYSYTTKKYIFCGIPDSNWSSFNYGGYGDSDSYGERFHKYIMDYQCDCN